MEEQNNPQTGTPIYQQSQEKNAKWLWLLIMFIVIGALVFAYVRGFGPFESLKSQLGGDGEEASPTPSVSSSFFESPSPEATIGAELDKSEFEIAVLNGSGTVGVASSMQDTLESAGYTVGSVGNADNYDYENTEVRAKKDFEQYVDLIVKDLSDDYSAVAGETLDSSETADIQVIVGAK